MRSRAVYVLVALAVIALGLASRKYASILPSFVGLYAGDTLWAALAFTLVAIVRPAWSSMRVAAVALAVCYAVEVSQLYRAPWIDAVRHTRLGGLALGYGFLWRRSRVTRSASQPDSPSNRSSGKSRDREHDDQPESWNSGPLCPCDSVGDGRASGCFSCSTPTKPAAASQPTVDNPLSPKPTDVAEVSMPEATTADLMADALHADAIVAAKVMWLGPAPDRPGNPCATQGVSYQIVEVFRGSVPEGEIRVAHPVCIGRPLVDNRAISLSRALFAPGKQYILFLRRDPAGTVKYVRYDGDWTSTYAVWDERAGTIPDAEAVRAEVRKAVAATRSESPSGGEPFAGGRRRR